MKLFWMLVGVFALCSSVAARADNYSANLMIQSQLSGDHYCMDADQDRKAEGTEVFLYRCHGRENQRWAITSNTDGTGVIVGTGGLCLDVRSAGSRDGTPVQLWRCHFQANQRFRIFPDGTIREVQSQKCLLAAAPADHASIVLDECKGLPQERWHFAQ